MTDRYIDNRFNNDRFTEKLEIFVGVLDLQHSHTNTTPHTQKIYGCEYMIPYVIVLWLCLFDNTQ